MSSQSWTRMSPNNFTSPKSVLLNHVINCYTGNELLKAESTCLKPSSRGPCLNALNDEIGGRYPDVDGRVLLWMDLYNYLSTKLTFHLRVASDGSNKRFRSGIRHRDSAATTVKWRAWNTGNPRSTCMDWTTSLSMINAISWSTDRAV